jgi:DNA uptake protein ComE-like DNA-binding protein
MSFKTTVAALALVLSTGAAFAQAQPATPARPAAPAAPAAQPATPPKAAAPAPAAQPAAKQGALVNVNTANADELDKLPQIGPARSKAIIDNRVAAKGGAYKDLADLEKRADLPSNAIAAIKDKIRFR